MCSDLSACCVGQQQHVGYLLPTALAALQQWQFVRFSRIRRSLFKTKLLEEILNNIMRHSKGKTYLYFVFVVLFSSTLPLLFVLSVLLPTGVSDSSVINR